MSRLAPVTVVIPAWQAGEFLAATLESLRGQTTPPEAWLLRHPHPSSTSSLGVGLGCSGSGSSRGQAST